MSRGRTLRAAGAAAALAAAGLLAWSLAFPVDARDRYQDLRLRLGGVRRVRVGGLTALFRDTCGSGPDCRCVALVHGLGDSAETWSRILLDERGAPVPRGLRLYALNMPGTEGSAAPASPEGYGIPAFARVLRETLEPICPRWTVAGNSLGGWSAAWLAGDWPQGVSRLILLDPAGLDDPTGLSEETARTLSEPTAENLAEFMRRAYFKRGPFPKRVLAQAAERIRSRPTRETVQALSKEDFLDRRLPGIRPGTVILWGDSDRLIPPSQGGKFRALLRGSELRILKDCGHLPQMECPDQVRPALFTAAASGSTPEGTRP